MRQDMGSPKRHQAAALQSWPLEVRHGVPPIGIQIAQEQGLCLRSLPPNARKTKENRQEN